VLWEDLHHQSDVDEASYAAVILLARSAGGWPHRPWHLYALVATIEVERHAIQNPDCPAWLRDDYLAAMRVLKSLALDDLRGPVEPLVLRAALALVAAASGDHALAAMWTGFDESDIAEWNEDRLAYSARYRIKR
jgi:hypothetical protein